MNLIIAVILTLQCYTFQNRTELSKNDNLISTVAATINTMEAIIPAIHRANLNNVIKILGTSQTEIGILRLDDNFKVRTAKLDTIEPNVDIVTGELRIAGVKYQPDWLETDTLSQRFILNKPSSVLENVTVQDYTTLRSLEGSTLAEAILVEDFEYLFDEIMYKTIGGKFHKVTSGTENGATLIVADDGTKWARVFDGRNYYTDWFEVGGIDRNGNSYVNPQSDQGVFSDWARVINMVDLAGAGATIHLPKNQTMLFDVRSNIHPNQKFIGYNTTLKRIDCPNVFLTSAASAGATTINVDAPSVLRIGQKVGIVSGEAFNQNDGNSNSRITSISGNVISLSNGLVNGVASGDRVIIESRAFENTNNNDDEEIFFHNIKFHGNKIGNPHTLDWRYNYTITVLGVGRTTITDCYFEEMPNENIYASVATIDNCYFKNLNGSLMHISNTTTRQFGTMIKNCKGDGFNQGTNDLMSHSDALLTFSFNSSDITISNCRFKNGREAVIGESNQDEGSDINMKVLDSDFLDWNSGSGKLFNHSTSTTNLEFRNFEIANCRFQNCGDIEIQGNSIYQQEGVNNIKINGNNFKNSRMFLKHVSNVQIIDNRMEYMEDGSFTGWTTANAGDGGGFIVIENGDRITIDNNTLVGPLNIPGTEVSRHGISINCDNAGFRKDGTGTNTNYYYPQNVRITNNVIQNFARCISFDNTHAGSYEGSTIGWVISNNILTGPRDLSYTATSWIMQVPPGAVAEHNKIYVNYSNPNSFPIRAYGVHAEVDTTLADKLIGSIIRFNTIIGIGTRSIAVGSSNTPRSRHKMYVGNNIVCAAVNDFSGGNSTIEQNTVMTITEAPDVQMVGENNGQY